MDFASARCSCENCISASPLSLPLLPELYGSFQIHARSVPRFPSRWRNLRFIRRSVKIFANVKRKEEAFSGLAFCPWLLDCHGFTTTRARWPGQFVGFLTQRRNACCSLFANFRGKNRWIARVLVARVVDGEGIESRITEYPKNKKKEEQSTWLDPLAYPRRAIEGGWMGVRLVVSTYVRRV